MGDRFVGEWLQCGGVVFTVLDGGVVSNTRLHPSHFTLFTHLELQCGGVVFTILDVVFVSHTQKVFDRLHPSHTHLEQQQQHHLVVHHISLF